MKIFLSGLKIGKWTHTKKLKIESLNQNTIICAFILYVWWTRIFSLILCCWKLTNVRIKSPWLINNSKYKAILDRCFFNCACNFHSHSGAVTGEDNEAPKQPTFRRGLSLVSMMKSYLQSSQQRVSELLIHWCRQAWWTKRRVPVQRHGVIRGLSSSPSQWQILTQGQQEQVSQPANQQCKGTGLFTLLSHLRLDIQKMPGIWPFRWRPRNILLFPFCHLAVSLHLVIISLWICYVVWRRINRNNSFSLLCMAKPLRQIPEQNSSWSVSNANKTLKGREILPKLKISSMWSTKSSKEISLELHS